MTYLNDVHGIIIGGFQSYIGDECVHDYNGNIIQLVENPPQDRQHLVQVARAHGAHKIASFLREYGADVEVIDYAFAWHLEEWKDLWKSRYNSKTLFLCVSTAFRQSSLFLWQFVDWVKNNYPHIAIIGGTQSIDKILPFKLDWYCFGYGEYAMLELIKNLRDGTTSKMKYYEVGDRKIINAQEHYPAFPKRSMKISYEDRDFIKHWEILPMEWSRGCIFRCAFCTYPILGVKDDHSRDENDLYDELMENYERWGIVHYALSDETVNDYHKKLERYAKVIKKLPFKPRFGGYARGDIIAATERHWDTYIELGFTNHFYGIESLHHPSAKAVGKGMDSGKLKEGLIKFKEYIMENHDFYAGHISLIAGLPHETLKTLDDGNDWLKKYWNDNFTAIGILSINLPLYVGKYAYVAEKLANISLIEKNPESYGYKIHGEIRKRGLWTLDSLKDEENDFLSKEHPLSHQIEKGKEDEVSKRVQVKWTNNVGLTTEESMNWLRTNGSVLTAGTLPTWSLAEYLIDPSLKYTDMMLKSDKRDRIMAYNDGRYMEDENLMSNYPEHINPKEPLVEKKNNWFEFNEWFWKDPKTASYEASRSPPLDLKSKEGLTEVQGTVFTSAGFNTTASFKQRKMKYINDYIRNKINA
jgi:hypothetical protein